MNTAAPDSFSTCSTRTLTGIAWTVTPARDRGRWIATADNREWVIRDGQAIATNGARDNEGRLIEVMNLPEEDLREFVIEQLEALGITLADVNRMKS